MSYSLHCGRSTGRGKQRGQGLLILLAVLGIGTAAVIYTMVTPASLTIERDKKTAAALAEAKAALIGFAAGVNFAEGASRLGDLPCPDLDNDGFSDNFPPCSGSVVGRLPWKSLGLQDLRDGDGERLWYAVSSNFKNNPRTSCTSPGQSGCLSSDSRGTITIRDQNGNVIDDGSNPDPFNPSGAIAVIIAPGRVLQRQGAASAQIRGCTVGVDCDATEQCTASPVTLTPKCNPVNYLDVLSGTEDNADFAESGNITNGFIGSSTNGFINGDILDAGGNLIVNDRLITITYRHLMPLIERRVAHETLNCLVAYASLPQNNGRYPWTAEVDDLTYQDKEDKRFGRIPVTLNDTVDTASGMAGNWPASCSMTQGTWWNNWMEMVFYGVADAYKPVSGVPAGGPCGNCLTVDPPSSSDNKRVVVIVAGKRLSSVNGGQPRSSAADKKIASNFVEDQNDGSATQNVYTQKPASASFNDVLLFQ